MSKCFSIFCTWLISLSWRSFKLLQQRACVLHFRNRHMTFLIKYATLQQKHVGGIFGGTAGSWVSAVGVYVKELQKQQQWMNRKKVSAALTARASIMRSSYINNNNNNCCNAKKQNHKFIAAWIIFGEAVMVTTPARAAVVGGWGGSNGGNYLHFNNNCTLCADPSNCCEIMSAFWRY